MVTIRLPYVNTIKRKSGTAYRYRRIVPPELVQAVGRAHWLHSWRPGTSLAVVEREAGQLTVQHDRAITAAKGEIEAGLIEKAETSARSWLARDRRELFEFQEYILSQGEPTPDDARFLRAVEGGGVYYQPVRLSEITATGDKPLAYAARSFLDLLGDMDVATIKRAHVRQWLEAQERAGLAPATLQRRLGALRAVVGRAILDADLDRPNPFASHRIKGGGGGERDRLPFSKDMINLIDNYLATGAAGDETRHLIQIMRNTGTGPAEAGGLAVADVILDHDVPHLHVRANGLRSLKARSRDRRLPLLGVALEAAGEAVERATGPGLFPIFNRSGRGADAISAKCNKAIRAAGIPKSPRLVVYSFRHGIAEALRATGAPYHIGRQLMGHSSRDIGDRYGSPQGRLADACEALTAALADLGNVDPGIYSEAEQLNSDQ